MKTLNIQLLAVMMILLAVAGIGIYFLHGYQVQRSARVYLNQAEAAKTRAQEAEDDGQFAEALEAQKEVVRNLQWYVRWKPDDLDRLQELGFALAEMANYPAAFQTFERLLRLQPTRYDARRELVDIALKMRRYAHAKVHLQEHLLKDNPDDPALLELLGKCQAAVVDFSEGGNNFEKARESYERAIDLAPGQVSTYRLLAELIRSENLERTEKNSALKADEVMQELVKRNPDSFEARLSRGEYLRQHDKSDNFNKIGERRKIEEAMAEALEALNLKKDDPRALWLAARCALDNEDFETGRKYARRGIKLYPEDVAMYTALADIELREEKWEDAIVVLRKGLEKNEDHQQLLWSIANLLIDTGQLTEAEEVISKLSVGDYPAMLVDYLKARVLFTRGKWLAACEAFESVRIQLSLMPDLSKKVDLWLGKAYGKLGNHDQEAAAYRRALVADRFFAAARLGLAKTLLDAGRLDEAMVECAHIRDTKQTHRRGAIPWARMQVLRALQVPKEKRDWQSAEKAIVDAARLVPDSVDIPILQAEILLAQGKANEAEALLTRARDEKPEEVEFWRSLALLAQREKKWERVEQILDEAQRRIGDKPALRNARARYLVARYGKESADRLWKLTENCEEFSDLERVQLWQGLVAMLLQAGDLARAKELCEQIIAIDPNRIGTHFQLFELALRAENPKEMENALKRIEQVERGPIWQFAQALLLKYKAEGPDDARLNQALGLLAKAKESRPTWSRIPLLAAAIYTQQEKLDAALESNLEAIKLGAQDPNTLRRTMEMLVYRENRVDEAYELLQRFNQVPPELLSLSRDIYLGRGNLNAALDTASKAAADSTNPQDHMWLAQILLLVAREANRRQDSTAAARMHLEAEEALKKATQLDPKDPAAWVAQVKFYVKMDQKDKAAEILERVRAEVPKEQLDLALARCYEAMKRIGEAQAIFDKMLANAPDDPTMVRTVTEFYLQANLRKTAMKQLQRLIDGEVKGTPVDLVWARYQMAKLLDATGAYADRQKGIELLKQNLVSGKSTFRNEQLLAHLIAKCPGAKNREKALEMFEEMMRERPSLAAEDLAAASKLYMAGGDRSKARDTMQKLLASHGNDPRYVAQYIQVLLQCGDLAGAKSWLKRLKEMAPRSMAVASLESEILIEEGEHTKAMEVLTAILHDAKTQSSNRMLLGRMVSLRLEELAQRLDGDKLADVRKQFIEEAEKTVRRLAEDYPTTKVNLAAFLARHEHFDEALSILEEGKETIDSFQLSKVCGIIIRNHQARSSQREQAEELIQLALKRTDRPDALLMVVADSYTRLTDYAKAEGIYRKAIQENPNHAIAMNNLAVLLAMQDENLDEALRLINKAIEIAGPEPAMLDSRATVYIARGESDKALVDIQAALNDAETPIRLFHLAQIYFNGGRPKSAVAAFTDAEKRGLTPSTVQPLELPIYRKFKSLQEKAKADRNKAGARNAP